MTIRKTLIFIYLFMTGTIHAQEFSFGKKMVDTLSSEIFWGRGYTKNGMQKAAGYLASELKSYGLQPMKGKSFFQYYSHPVNTFPGEMKLSINGKILTPGVDFIVSAESHSIDARGTLQQADSMQYMDLETRLIVALQDKLTWSASTEVADYAVVQLNKNRFSEIPQRYEVKIENELIKNFKAANVCGIVKGTRQPDSLIIITAHYDHLGGMGHALYFPGANDNASGVALVMNLAKYYAANPQPYSIGFILFGSEEIGLLGSKYFTENPLVPLPQIRFLINTDLAGTGDDGITVVNATEFPKEFALMNRVNDEEKLLVKINARGKAANSDHYFFTEKNVPAFFFYTLGGIAAYHDVYDQSSTLPLNEHQDLFTLVTGFVKKLISNN